MKRIITLMSAAVLALGANAQTITISSIDQTLANDYAGGCEIDLNNDGLKEIIISGKPQWSAAPGRIIEDADGNEVSSDFQSWVLTYNGTSYDKKEFSQLVGLRSHIIPADFNGDGYIDLFLAGEAYDYCGVYLNDGKGNFTKDSRFKWYANDGTEITTYGARAVDVADFNQDGLPDFVSIGWDNINSTRHDNCGVFINQGDGTFKNVLETGVIGDGTANFQMALCTVKAYDLNKDGYPDILLQGNVDNSDIKAVTKDGTKVGRTFMVLLNAGRDDEGTVSFYSTEIATGVSHQFGNGNIEVCDFNNDGVPDIFVTGESNSDAVSGWEYYPQLLLGKVTTTTEGNDVSYTEDNSFVASHKDIRPLNSNNIGVRAIDYDGDGYYDLFYPGWCTMMLDGSTSTQAGWLLNGSASGLTSYTRIPGASEQGILFLDYGVKGAANYTFTGFHGDKTYFDDNTDIKSGRSMVFTKNPNAVAARPDAPTGLQQTVSGKDVQLSWSPAASSKKNVTYEYYLKEKTTGKLYNNVTSFVGGDNDGLRKVLRPGNAYMDTEVTLYGLPDGTYEWGVQTVNAALRGSVFTKGGDIVIGSGVFNAISNVENNAPAGQPAYYNINGQRTSGLQHGINIVRKADGSVSKVLVK